MSIQIILLSYIINIGTHSQVPFVLIEALCYARTLVVTHILIQYHLNESSLVHDML